MPSNGNKWTFRDDWVVHALVVGIVTGMHICLHFNVYNYLPQVKFVLLKK